MTAEELLASEETEVYEYSDTIQIDGENRTIDIPIGEEFFGVEGDKDVTRKHFLCPKIVGDNIDLSEHNLYINYVLADEKGNVKSEDIGQDVAKNITVNEDAIEFDWKLSEWAMMNDGFVAFSVVAKRSVDGVLQTQWYTIPGVGRVAKTVKDGQDLTQKYPDVIDNLMNRVKELETIIESGSTGDVKSVNGQTGEVVLSAADVGARPDNWMPSASEVGADESGTAESKVSAHNTETSAHNDIRLLIEAVVNRLNVLADSDDETLDQASEFVAYMKANRDLIESITTSKVSVSDIVDDYVTNVSNKPVSAAVAVKLKALIDAITIPSKLSAFTDDVGYAKKATTLSGYGITDGATKGDVEELSEKVVSTVLNETLEEAVTYTVGTEIEVGDIISASYPNTDVSQITISSKNYVVGPVYTTSGNSVPYTKELEVEDHFISITFEANWTIVIKRNNIESNSYKISQIGSQVAQLSEEKVDQKTFEAHVENTNIHVTSEEKEVWNNKSDFSGSYNDLTDQPTIPSLDGYATEDYVDSEITDLKAQGLQQTPLYAQGDTVDDAIEWLKTNGDTSKVYVLPDGYLYGYKLTTVLSGGYTNLAEPLPENTTDTTTWVNGYRFGSSGISAQDGTTLSNPFECTNGDTFYIKGVTLRENTDRLSIDMVRSDTGESYTGVVYFNATHDVFTFNGINDDGVYSFTLTHAYVHEVKAVRFAMPTPEDASQVIITVNEEIVEPTATQEYAWTNTGHAFVPNDYDEEFVELNNEITGLKEDITELENANQAIKESLSELEANIENVGATEIPDYWQEHLDSKIETIKSLHKQYGKDCFSIIHIVDIHYTSNLGKLSPLLAEYIMDETQIKYAISDGDMQTRGCHKTKDALLTENEAILEMFSPIINRTLFQKGNHDGAYGTLDRDGDGTLSNVDSSGNVKDVSERETYVNNLTPQEFHEYCYRKVGMVGNVHFDETGTAYYIDDISNNARYIGLNTQCNDYELQDDGTQKYPTMWIMRYTQSQFDFLTNKALVGMEDNTKVVVFSHVPPTQELGDGSLMIGLLKAFKNKTTYSGSYTGTSENGYDAVSINCDFTNAKGVFYAYVHGHNHVDSVNTENGFNIIGTRCDAKEENDTTLNNERVKGTITEQSFDVLTFTPDITYATKIGAGDDREIPVI